MLAVKHHLRVVVVEVVEGVDSSVVVVVVVRASVVVVREAAEDAVVDPLVSPKRAGLPLMGGKSSVHLEALLFVWRRTLPTLYCRRRLGGSCTALWRDWTNRCWRLLSHRPEQPSFS